MRVIPLSDPKHAGTTVRRARCFLLRSSVGPQAAWRVLAGIYPFSQMKQQQVLYLNATVQSKLCFHMLRRQLFHKKPMGQKEPIVRYVPSTSITHLHHRLGHKRTCCEAPVYTCSSRAAYARNQREMYPFMVKQVNIPFQLLLLAVSRD